MTVRQRLRDDLKTALRSDDAIEVSMIRTLIGAIENAEAVPAELSVEPKIGLGHDQPRRALADDDIVGILESERAEVSDALARYRELKLTREVDELEHRLTVIDRYLA